MSNNKPDFMNYTPVKALATGFEDWRIKVRIIKKYEKRSYPGRDGRNGGQVLSIDMVDGFGTMIQGTFFNDAVNRFDPLLRENHVYLFANGEIKLANKRFTNIKNDYCIVFNMNTEL